MFARSLLGAFACFFTWNVYAVTFSFEDYFPTIDTGEKWNYTGPSNFSLSLSSVNSGPYTGLNKLGNENTGIVFSADSGVVTWYTYNNRPLSPKLVFDEQYQTDQIYIIDGREVVFVSLSDFTVPAGTFNNVIAMVWLHPAYDANAKNVELGISQSLTLSAVTDIDYYAKGIGIIAYEAVDIINGAVVGTYGLDSLQSKTRKASGLHATNNTGHSLMFSDYMVSPFQK